MRPAILRLAPLLAAAALAAGCGPQLPLAAPQWSPDGSRVAFVRYAADGEFALYLADPAAEDAAPRLLAGGVERFAFAGNRLYWLRPPGKDDRGGLVAAELGPDGPGAPEVALPPGPGERFTAVQAAPGGLLYLEKRDAQDQPAVIEFDPAAGKARTVSPVGAACFGPQVSPRGAELAWLAPAKDGGLEVVRKALPDGEPAVLARLEKAQADSALLAWSPDGAKLLAAFTEEPPEGAASGRGAVVLLDPRGKGEKGRRDWALPEDRAPLLAGFAPDGRTVFLSLLAVAEADGGQAPGCESWELSAAGEFRKLAEARGKLLGARAYAPGGRRWVELTAGGLALFEAGRAEPARLWPLDFTERIAGARAALAAGKAARAVELACAAMNAAGPADDRSAMQLVKADALDAAGQTRDAADAYLESLLRYPVTVRPEPDAQIARRLARYADARPEDRLLPALVEAWKLRAAGKFEAAAEGFKEAAALSADRAWSAGMSFAAARALLDAGRASSAGALFRKVSEVADFPQADWAAGLAAAAYALAGREDLAAEEVQRCKDLFAKSALAGDFAALGRTLAERAGKPRTAEEVAAPAGGATARLEAWPATGLHLAFAPGPAAAGGAARLGVVRYERWRLVLAPPEGGDVLLLDKVPEPLARLSFSPDGKRLAFLAGPEGRRSLYAVDLGGKQLMGDLKKLFAGHPDPASRAEDYRWPEDGKLPEAVAAKE